MPKRGDSANYALTQQQVQAVLAACRDLTDQVIIGSQLFLGLRAREVAHMRDEWVTSNGELRIPHFMPCSCSECLAKKEGGGWTPKTKAGARTLYIPSRLCRYLSELFQVKPYGLGMSRQSIYNRTKAVLKRAEVKYGFPHALRSTCLTMLAQGGMSAVNLCVFAGWKNIAIGSHYIQVALARQGSIEQAKEIFG